MYTFSQLTCSLASVITEATDRIFIYTSDVVDRRRRTVPNSAKLCSAVTWFVGAHSISVIYGNGRSKRRDPLPED